MEINKFTLENYLYDICCPTQKTLFLFLISNSSPIISEEFYDSNKSILFVKKGGLGLARKNTLKLN